MAHRTILLESCISHIETLLSLYDDDIILESVGLAFKRAGHDNMYVVSLNETEMRLLEAYKENYQGEHCEVREYRDDIEKSLLRKL